MWKNKQTGELVTLAEMGNDAVYVDSAGGEHTCTAHEFCRDFEEYTPEAVTETASENGGKKKGVFG